jgi:hypothetical protein
MWEENSEALCLRSPSRKGLEVFPPLMPCELQGRSYPVWPESEHRSIPARVLALLERLQKASKGTRSRKYRIAKKAQEARNQQQHGSGSW